MWKTIVLCIVLAGLCTGVVVGCAQLKEFGKGAAVGAAMSGREAAKERLASDERIPAEMRPVVEGMIDAVVDSLPKPEPASNPAEGGFWMFLGMILAKLGGDALKGYIRSRQAKKE